MPQVVAHGRQLGAAIQRMGGVGVPHPMRCGPPELLGHRRTVTLDNQRSRGEESLHVAPQPRCGDPGLVVQAANDRSVAADGSVRGLAGGRQFRTE